MKRYVSPNSAWRSSRRFRICEDDPADAKGDVLGGERVAVVERRAVPEREPGRPGLDALPLGGQPLDDAALLVPVEEPFVGLADDDLRIRLGVILWVEPRIHLPHGDRDAQLLVHSVLAAVAAVATVSRGTPGQDGGHCCATRELYEAPSLDIIIKGHYTTTSRPQHVRGLNRTYFQAKCDPESVDCEW